MNQLIEFFCRRGVFSNLLTFVVFAFGLLSTVLISREIFPNVNFDIITVTTVFPGATPEQVEKLITNPIEQDLKEVDGIKKLTSVSAEGRSVITIQLDPDQTDEETAKTDVRTVIDQLDDFPDQAEDPLVVAINSDQTPVIEVSISGDLPLMDLRNIAKSLEDELEGLYGVAKVSPTGMRDIEIHIEIDERKLDSYGLTLTDVFLALKNQNTALPGGTVEPPSSNSGKSEIILRTSGEYGDSAVGATAPETLDEIRQTVIRANDLGRSIRIADLAKISYQLEKATLINRTDGEPAIRLTILKKKAADAIDLVDRLKEYLDQRKSTLDPKIQVSYVNDFSYFIRRRLSILTNNMMVGLTLVVIFLSMVLPFRVALITMLGIPFAFLGAMIVFFQAGISINLISMFGLIIVIGMLVDDAVVVTDNAVRRIEDGEDPTTAAIKGTQQVWIPVTASVFTTILAFYPLMVMDGIMGKFISVLPLGVVIALLISLLECYFVLPHHIAAWVTPASFKKAKKANSTLLSRILAKTNYYWYERIVPKYLQILEILLRRKYWVAVGSFFLFVGSMALLKFGMNFTLFPKDGIEIFFIRAETAVGTSLLETEARFKPIEKLVNTVPRSEMDNFVSEIGIQQNDPNDPFTVRASHVGQIKVFLKPELERERRADEIIDDLRSKIQQPEGITRITFARVNPGPPQGRPISVGIRGKEYEPIMKAVEELQPFVKEFEGATDVFNSFVPGKPEVWIRPLQGELAAAGLTVSDLGTVIRGAYEGIIPTSIKKLDEEIELRVNLDSQGRSRIETLKNLKIRNPSGALIPVSQVTEISERKGISFYKHEANRREVRITGDVDETITTSNLANAAIKKEINRIENKHPEVSFHIGGEADDTAESMVSLAIAGLIAVSSIFLILVFTFSNMAQPTLIMAITLPLGLIAVIWAFFFNGMPLSFMGLMGTIALAGVIVNNAIVFLSFVNEERSKGTDRLQSVLDAAKKRVRPIFLTTITTVAGILPTAYGIGGLDPFVVPCAMALGWGVFFGSFLTLFIFPPATLIFDDISDKVGNVLCKITGRERHSYTGTPQGTLPQTGAI